jgi:hypothetical protein
LKRSNAKYIKRDGLKRTNDAPTAYAYRTILARGRFLNNVEKIGKAAVPVGGAIHTMYQVGKGIGTVATLAAPLLGIL